MSVAPQPDHFENERHFSLRLVSSPAVVSHMIEMDIVSHRWKFYYSQDILHSYKPSHFASQPEIQTRQLE